MVIPIHDLNPGRRLPVVTWTLILLNFFVFFFGAAITKNGLPDNAPNACRQDAFIQHYAAIPKELTENQPLPLTRTRVYDGEKAVRCPAPNFHKNPALSALTSMFLHGGIAHLAGNMLFLFIFGNNVEDRFGRLGYLLFYLLCGYAAAYGFAFTDPNSTAPLIGASGAIAGVLGAYLWLYPRAKVVSLVPFLFFVPLPLPAWIVLGSWFLLQAVYANGAGVGDGSVAYMAHVVGFTVGLLLTMLYIGDRRERPPLKERHL